MKTLKHLLVLMLAILTSVPLIAQVGIGTTEPDDTAMLDIQSDSKGILIPRLTTEQRNDISNPATGLMVFDSTTKSFWFYSSGWIELVTGSTVSDKIQDSTPDTSVEVERTPDDDTIWFKTQGDDRMKITKDGVIYMGDSVNGNYTKVTTDGSLSYEGDATRWDDLRFPASSLNAYWASGPHAPGWSIFLGSNPGLYLPFFDPDAEEELYVIAQMPHGWKEGSTIYPHVHWTLTSANQGSNNVVWGLEYTWANVGGNFDSPGTPITGSTAVVGDQSADSHNLTPLGGIDATGKTLSSILICRIFRKAADSNDTVTTDVALLEFDIHYQIDSDGSNEQFTKW